MYHPHVDDKRAAISGREPRRHVYQVSDGSRATASLSGNPSFYGDEAAHTKREQSAGETTAVR